MNEEKNLIVAMTGTVTITAEEYKELVMSRALLEAIIIYQRNEGSYRLDDMVRVADAAISTVITVPISKKEDEEGA
jgi:capsular polysaccharide biosynthesis protein